MAKKTKAVTPDYMLEVTDDITLEVYERGTKNRPSYSAKLTFCDCFLVYGKIVEYKGKDKKPHGFLALPSWVNKDGERVSQAYFYDSEINETINEFIEKEII